MSTERQTEMQQLSTVQCVYFKTIITYKPKSLKDYINRVCWSFILSTKLLVCTVTTLPWTAVTRNSMKDLWTKAKRTSTATFNRPTNRSGSSQMLNRDINFCRYIPVILRTEYLLGKEKYHMPGFDILHYKN